MENLPNNWADGDKRSRRMKFSSPSVFNKCSSFVQVRLGECKKGFKDKHTLNFHRDCPLEGNKGKN